jgi:hypothetical protein
MKADIELLLSQYRDFIHQHCWLINSTVNPNEFIPVDQSQEHNIKNIKVSKYLFDVDV